MAEQEIVARAWDRMEAREILKRQVVGWILEVEPMALLVGKTRVQWEKEIEDDLLVLGFK